MRFEFQFPDIGEGIHEGVITKWMVQEGDNIEEGESVAEVETDKVTTEIPSPRSGKVLQLKANKGDTINVGDVFIVIDAGGGSEALDEGSKANEKEEVEEETAGVVGQVVSSSDVIPSSTEGSPQTKKTEERRKVLATPVARHLAKDLGVDINTVRGSGPNGRVMKDDIYKASEEKSEPEVKETGLRDRQPKKLSISEDLPVERIPLTKIRKTIAEKMSESRFTIPHTTAMDEIDISRLHEFRKKYKDSLKEEDVSLTYLPFIIKAAIAALKKYPEFNSSLDEENDELVLKKYFNIGVATDTERGLMVPVIKDADKMNLVEIAKAIEDLSTRAKDNQIQLSQLKGGSFSVTNYGSIGGYFGIPIINYPESAILGIGRVVEKPIVKDGEIVVAHILPLSLSYDHRIIDGASGARFLNLLKELLSNPDILLLKG
ncbi:MAG TPA: dihydrolipoamide acetyltransferase family protein [Tissierellaceae bacterium]|jgi:pyruvate dehydrogenase E2 component (dihydrolipoamide acetyltransferase)|nr:dihydrolipoamide acetyltransferase family protein [Tissierellaceae bacterium]